MDRETLSKAKSIELRLSTLESDFGKDEDDLIKFNSLHVATGKSGYCRSANSVLSVDEKAMIGLIVRNAIQRERKKLGEELAAL